SSINPIPGNFSFNYPPTPQQYSYYFAKSTPTKVIDYVNFLAITIYNDDNIVSFWEPRLTSNLRKQTSPPIDISAQPVTVASLGWILCIFSALLILSVTAFVSEFLVYR
ncbi:hypothetical protein PFISCL1PPCAC_20332, partial [Pristionchus fissidentatus]